LKVNINSPLVACNDHLALSIKCMEVHNGHQEFTKTVGAKIQAKTQKTTTGKGIQTERFEKL